VAVVLLFVLAIASPAPASAQQSGRELYDAACAACHDADGRGLSAAVLGFEPPVPDFTDCSFATPEAEVDWFAIVHSGGPARAFDRRMPAFGEALSAEDIRRILEHVRTFCTDDRWPRGELNLPRPLVTEKAFPENETVVTLGAPLSGAAAATTKLLYEQRVGARSQFEIVVPFASHETAAGWQSGVGDVAFAFKQVLAHSLRRGAIVSAAAEVVLPTGSEAEGLGGGETVLEPFLAFGQMLRFESFVQMQAGAELKGGGGREGFWRVAIGKTFTEARFGRAWSPMVELLGSRELAAGAPAHWDVVPQLQVSLSKRQHILLNAGVRVPANDRGGRHAQLLTYVLWDWFDGGLLEGWR
jgi:mono/diheme cytochrome c family protein